MSKIIGNTTATTIPRSDWTQNDVTKADYIKNKPTILAGEGINSLIHKEITYDEIISYYTSLFEPYSYNEDDVQQIFADSFGITPESDLNNIANGALAIALGTMNEVYGVGAVALGIKPSELVAEIEDDCKA